MSPFGLATVQPVNRSSSHSHPRWICSVQLSGWSPGKLITRRKSGGGSKRSLLRGPSTNSVTSTIHSRVSSGETEVIFCHTASPVVAGPPPSMLHLPNSVVAHGALTERGLVQARAFSRPDSAVALGARPAQAALGRAPNSWSSASPMFGPATSSARATSSSHFGGRLLGGGFAGSSAAAPPMPSPSYNSSPRPYFGSPQDSSPRPVYSAAPTTFHAPSSAPSGGYRATAPMAASSSGGYHVSTPSGAYHVAAPSGAGGGGYRTGGSFGGGAGFRGGGGSAGGGGMHTGGAHGGGRR